MPQTSKGPSPARPIRTGAVLTMRLDSNGRVRSRPHANKVLRPLVRSAASVSPAMGPDERAPGY